MGKKVLMFQGGWDGHDPLLVSQRFTRILEKEGFDVEVYDTLECLSDRDKLCTYDLIVPIWTGGHMPGGYSGNVGYAVGRGTGIAGCHGGMCDAFREDTEWQFITGGNWVSHPGGDGTEYIVNVRRNSSPLTEGIEDFKVKSEQYYLHVDPAVEVLASTRFPNPTVAYYHSANKAFDMPVVWTKYWGDGRVFYSSLGHHDAVFEESPAAEELMRRGMIWAAGGKDYVREHNLDPERYMNTAKMY